MQKRTWMKVTKPYGRSAIWLAVEGDAIVAYKFWERVHPFAVPMRADDTLSRYRAEGWKIEGPFDAPE